MPKFLYSTFCLDTKSGAKKSRQKQMLRCFCRAHAQITSLRDTKFLRLSSFLLSTRFASLTTWLQALLLRFEHTPGAVIPTTFLPVENRRPFDVGMKALENTDSKPLPYLEFDRPVLQGTQFNCHTDFRSKAPPLCARVTHSAQSVQQNDFIPPCFVHDLRPFN